jgi:hypothetical protein
VAGWIAVFLGAAAAVIVVCRWQTRRYLLSGRQPVPLDRAFAAVSDQVSERVFREVWIRFAEAYSVDPLLLRPADQLRAYYDADSWDLWMGGDQLEEWLGTLGLARIPASVTTVLDLAKWIEAADVLRDTERQLPR